MGTNAETHTSRHVKTMRGLGELVLNGMSLSNPPFRAQGPMQKRRPKEYKGQR